MAQRRTITAANASLTIVAPQVYPAPQRIEGFATDDAFTLGDNDVAEVVMGVDGKMSAGYVPAIKEIEIVLQADSPSNDVFDQILAASEGTREVVFLDANFSIPALGYRYNLTNGVLKSASRVPAVKKTLQPRRYKLQFETVSKSVI